MHTRIRWRPMTRTLRQRFAMAAFTGAFVVGSLLVQATPAAAADNSPCTLSTPTRI